MTNIASYAQKDSILPKKEKPNMTIKKIQIPKVDHQKIIKIMPEYILDQYGNEIGLALLREHFMIEINAVRKKYNKGEVVMDEYLNQKAQEYAQYMSDNEHFSHYDKQGRTLDAWINVDNHKYYQINEVLKFGVDNIKETVEGWMRSPGHKATIIESKYYGEKTIFNRCWFGYKDGYYIFIFWAK